MKRVKGNSGRELKSFRVGRCTVDVPKEIVDAAQSLDPGLTADVVESLGNVWTKRGADWEEAKQLPVTDGIEALLSNQIQKESEAESVLAELLGKDSADSECELRARQEAWEDRARDLLFRLLRCSRYRDLSAHPVRVILGDAVRSASRKNDHGFFTRLARALREKPLPFRPPREFTPLARFLVDHWITEDGRWPQFCFFTNQAIDDFVREFDPGMAPTLDAVAKTIQRLKLKKGPALITKVTGRRGQVLLG